MNTAAEAKPASLDQIKANVARWRREHGLETKPKLSKGRLHFNTISSHMPQPGRGK